MLAQHPLWIPNAFLINSLQSTVPVGVNIYCVELPTWWVYLILSIHPPKFKCLAGVPHPVSRLSMTCLPLNPKTSKLYQQPHHPHQLSSVHVYLISFSSCSSQIPVLVKPTHLVSTSDTESTKVYMSGPHHKLYTIWKIKTVHLPIHQLRILF